MFVYLFVCLQAVYRGFSKNASFNYNLEFFSNKISFVLVLRTFFVRSLVAKSKMANLLFRQFRLARRLQPVLARNKRCMSIFTNEREPPNGFLFNEKARQRINSIQLYFCYV